MMQIQPTIEPQRSPIDGSPHWTGPQQRRLTHPLTKTELQAYQQDGFLLIRSVFSPSEVDIFLREADRMVDYTFQTCLNLNLDANYNLRFELLPNGQPWKIDPFISASLLLATVVADRRLMDRLSSIYDGDEGVLFKDKPIFKPADSHGNEVHQDYNWWQGFPKSLLTVVVALDQLSQSLRQRSKEDPGSVSSYTLTMLEPGPPASLVELAARYQKLFLTLDELLKAHLDFYLLREELDSQRLAQEKNTEIPENTKLSDPLKEQTKLTQQSCAIATKLDNIEIRLGASSGSGVLKNLKAVKDHLQEAIKAQQEAQEKLLDGKARESVELRRQAHDFLEQASQRIQKLPKKHEERIHNFVDKVRLEGISRLLLIGDDSPFILTQKAEEQRYSEDRRSQIAKLRKNIENLKAQAPSQPSWAVAIREAEEMVDLPVHLGGNHLTKVDTPTPRGFLRMTDHLVKPPRPPENQSGRLELARWLTDASHPLTARVMVNRIWQWHFGTGLVDTPNNFGIRGGQPSHPMLLDYLATRFIELDWSVKKLNREIVLSNTYQLSTEHHAGKAEKDTDNKMFWRMKQRRLEVEPIRDALLALGGNLDLTMGGRVSQYKPGRGDRDRFVFSEGATWFRLKEELYIAPRRSVYLPVIRNALFPMFSVFDYADASAPIGNRSSTVLATQALLMMNSSFVIEQAERFARELLKDSLISEDHRIETAFIRAYGRAPNRTEMTDAKRFLKAMRQQASSQTSENDLVPIDEFAWSKFTHVMVSASEFIYID